MEKPVLIAVTGADGSGKSTLCRSLAEKFQGREVSIWDALGGTQGLLFQSRRDVMEYLCSLNSHSRVLFLFHAVAVALERGLKLGNSILLLNGYWYKYAVSELGYGAEWEMTCAAALGFPRPDLVLELKLPPELALQRKQGSGGGISPYERGWRAESEEREFILFQESLQLAWRRVRDAEGPWQEISADRPPLQVLSEAETKIWEAFPHIKSMR